MSLFDTLRLGEVSELPHKDPMTAGVAVIDLPGGPPLAGLHYVTDFRCEEEMGVGELRRAITGPEKRRFKMLQEARQNIAVFDDVNGFVVSTSHLDSARLKWGESIPYGFGDHSRYAKMWSQRLQSQDGTWKLNFKTVAELRQLAKEAGVKPLPTRKGDLVEAITRARATEANDRDPRNWPAWFYDGANFVVRADYGLTADLVRYLIDAIDAGTLGIGNGSSGFASGLVLYDTRDETREQVAHRNHQFDLFDQRMADLEPVRRELEEDGYGFYALGNPRVMDTGDGQKVVRYWMNSMTGPKLPKQAFGWFTLDELRDRSFAKKFAATS